MSVNPHHMYGWPIAIAVVIILLLVHTIYQTAIIAWTEQRSPPPPPIPLSEAMPFMGNGDIIICYPRRGGGSIPLRFASELICVISRSFSQHVAMIVYGKGTNQLEVLDCSCPMTRLIPVEQYVKLCHNKGLYIIWRPLRNGGIPRSVTEQIMQREVGQRFPTPIQMFVRQIAVLTGNSHMQQFMGNSICIGLDIKILRAAGIIPVDTDTRRWTTDSLSARCWPADNIFGAEWELI